MSDDKHEPDSAVIDALPKGAKVLSVTKTGKSDWTTTTCLSVILPDKSEKKYFLKTAAGETGKIMLRGEYTAATAMHNAIPSLTAKPLAWGKYTSSDDYFLLHPFLHITHPPHPTPTDRDRFITRLVTLHRTATSPNGVDFGFSVPTCDGPVPHHLAWQPNWARFYADLLSALVKRDIAANGAWGDFDTVFTRLLDSVIPHLLGALQADGRVLRPSLIHGDLGEWNFAIDEGSGEIVFIDASGFYAHNELELGLWRWAPSMQPYTELYLRAFPPSEPAEEWDDRNRLYSIKTKLNMSVDHPGEDGRGMRRVAYEDMCYLCDKYAPATASQS